jgi:dTDP-4-amino-4,6-dideoxygalactose transaminase
LFHTGEGGAIFCNDENLYKQFYYSHNFGHNGPLDFHGLGINAKISELQSAMGLAVFPYMNYIISERKKAVDFYNKNLSFNNIRSLKIRDNTDWNYSYYPVIFDSEEVLLKIQEILASENIFPRRYFYPSLNTIDYTKGAKMPISESIASRIMCLPLYVGISTDDLKKTIQIINKQTS